MWNYLLGRWTAHPVLIRRLVNMPALTTTAAKDFTWPTTDSVNADKTKHVSTHTSYMRLKDVLWEELGGSIWVPDDANDLQFLLCEIAHAGCAG